MSWLDVGRIVSRITLGVHIASAYESNEEKNVECIASVSCKDTKERFPAYPSFGLQ